MSRNLGKRLLHIPARTKVNRCYCLPDERAPQPGDHPNGLPNAECSFIHRVTINLDDTYQFVYRGRWGTMFVYNGAQYKVLNSRLE